MSGQDWQTLGLFSVAILIVSFFSRDAAVYLAFGAGAVMFLRSNITIGGTPSTGNPAVGNAR